MYPYKISLLYSICNSKPDSTFYKPSQQSRVITFSYVYSQTMLIFQWCLNHNLICKIKPPNQIPIIVCFKKRHKFLPIYYLLFDMSGVPYVFIIGMNNARFWVLLIGAWLYFGLIWGRLRTSSCVYHDTFTDKIFVFVRFIPTDWALPLILL